MYYYMYKLTLYRYSDTDYPSMNTLSSEFTPQKTYRGWDSIHYLFEISRIWIPVSPGIPIVVMSYRFYTLGIHALEKCFMATCKHFLVLSISLWWVWRHDTYGNEPFADPFCIFVFWLLHIWPLIQWGVEVLKSPFLKFLHSTVKGVCIVKGKEVFDSSKWFWSSKEY